MAPPANRAGFTIGRARLAGGHAGDRERLSAAIDRVSLAAIGLSPRAMLILRRFAAPRPLAHSGALDGFVGSIETSLRERAAAARSGRAGDDLYFDDEDAIDLALVRLTLTSQGPLPAWAALLPGGGEPMARWRRTILTEPARLSPLVARLVEAGQAAAWLMRFDPAEIASAETRILAAHGAPSIASASTGQNPAPKHGRLPSPDVSRLAASIRHLQPEYPRNASTPAVDRLILIALVAERRPALLTASGFVEAMALLTAADPPVRPMAPVPSSRARAARNSVAISPVRRSAVQPDAPFAHMPEPIPIEIPSGPPPEPPLPTPAVATSPPPYAASNLPGAAEIETRFGGVFFLLNVFVALDLWGDFTRPRDGLPGLSPFELIGMLGRHWYGRAFADDPIDAAWRSIAGLGPGDRPGAHFAAPVWSVPAQWLAPWPNALALRRGPNHWHPAGFPWRDGARAEPAAQRRRRWTWALARYLDARLAVALGEEHAAAARDLVCLRPGRVAIEPDRITVRFALEDHPIALRLAGLDRDPGRLAGTTAALCFEFHA